MGLSGGSGRGLVRDGSQALQRTGAGAPRFHEPSACRQA
jgi:hypothetical protein